MTLWYKNIHMSQNAYTSVRKRRARRFRNTEHHPGERYTSDEARRVFSDFMFDRTPQQEDGVFIVRRNAHILEDSDKIARVLKKFRGVAEPRINTAGVTVVPRGTIHKMFGSVDQPELVRPISEAYVRRTMYYSLLGSLGIAYSAGNSPYYVQIGLDDRTSGIIEAEYQTFVSECFGRRPGESFAHITLAKTEDELQSHRIAREINFARVHGGAILLEGPQIIHPRTEN